MMEEFWKWRNSMVLTDTETLSLEGKWGSNFSAFWHATHRTFLLRSYLPSLHSDHHLKITLKYWFLQAGLSKIVICVVFCCILKMSRLSIVQSIIFLNPCFKLIPAVSAWSRTVKSKLTPSKSIQSCQHPTSRVCFKFSFRGSDLHPFSGLLNKDVIKKLIVLLVYVSAWYFWRKQGTFPGKRSWIEFCCSVWGHSELNPRGCSDKDVTAAPQFGLCHGAWVILHTKKDTGKTRNDTSGICPGHSGCTRRGMTKAWLIPTEIHLPHGGEALQWRAADSKALCVKNWETPGRALWQMPELSREKFPKSDGKQESLSGSRLGIRKHLLC